MEATESAAAAGLGRLQAPWAVASPTVEADAPRRVVTVRAPGETYDVVVQTKDMGLQFSSVTNGCVVDGVDGYASADPPPSLGSRLVAVDGVRVGPPPDLPSLLLNNRIVYIGMPLAPSVTELVVAELLFLNYEQVDRPGYVYIHSPGSINEKGECVGVDSEAYAILDTMRYIRPKIHTVAVGKCFGNAAMLLAAGDKGCRHALPNAQIMTHPPKLNRTFDTSVNVQIKANEIEVCEDTYMGFMSEFSGKPIETVKEELDRRRYFTPQQAIDYGLIDRVIQKGTDVFEKRNYEAELMAAQAGQRGAMPTGR